MKYKNEIQQLAFALNKIAPPFSLTDKPPISLKELNDLDKQKPIPISNEFSDKTIYGDAHINYCFRSWHDTLHIMLQADMTFQDEMMLGKLHTETIERLRLPEICQAIMYFDTCGQTIYHKIHDKFIDGQKQFVLACLDMLTTNDKLLKEKQPFRKEFSLLENMSLESVSYSISRSKEY